MKKQTIPLVLSALALFFIIYLAMEVKSASDEYRHWRTRESVLKKELEVLREEARGHQQFLDRLRRNPDFQDEVARKELGYGRADEWLYRFPSDPGR